MKTEYTAIHPISGKRQKCYLTTNGNVKFAATHTRRTFTKAEVRGLKLAK